MGRLFNVGVVNQNTYENSLCKYAPKMADNQLHHVVQTAAAAVIRPTIAGRNPFVWDCPIPCCPLWLEEKTLNSTESRLLSIGSLLPQWLIAIVLLE